RGAVAQTRGAVAQTRGAVAQTRGAVAQTRAAPVHMIQEDVVGPLPALIEELSERELEVLALIADGLTNREIAERLYIATGTVKTHTSSIYGKLDVHSRTQAVARAHALGILSSP
ncbi:MAG: response regulator transcription factor, partial [Anaerolineae bacterium]|nr:response regulator transcription factor [Anaerolineae bacterium]